MITWAGFRKWMGWKVADRTCDNNLKRENIKGKVINCEVLWEHDKWGVLVLTRTKNTYSVMDEQRGKATGNNWRELTKCAKWKVVALLRIKNRAVYRWRTDRRMGGELRDRSDTSPLTRQPSLPDLISGSTPKQITSSPISLKTQPLITGRPQGRRGPLLFDERRKQTAALALYNSLSYPLRGKRALFFSFYRRKGKWMWHECNTGAAWIYRKVHVERGNSFYMQKKKIFRTLLE